MMCVQVTSRESTNILFVWTEIIKMTSTTSDEIISFLEVNNIILS